MSPLPNSRIVVHGDVVGPTFRKDGLLCPIIYPYFNKLARSFIYIGRELAGFLPSWTLVPKFPFSLKFSMLWQTSLEQQHPFKASGFCPSASTTNQSLHH
ncbi:hypothetical protein ACFX15_038234 [Malus domestica]